MPPESCAGFRTTALFRETAEAVSGLLVKGMAA
jgi:hypothetical protein